MTFQVSQHSIFQYILRRKKDLILLKHALKNRDFLHIRAIAHQIKGNAATFGFNKMGECATDLELSATQNDLSSLQIHLTRLEDLIHESEVLTNAFPQEKSKQDQQ